MIEELFNDSTKYSIQDILFEIVKEDSNTVVIINSEVYYHCGDLPNDISTAIMVFENYFSVKLSEKELENLLNESI